MVGDGDEGKGATRGRAAALAQLRKALSNLLPAAVVSEIGTASVPVAHPYWLIHDATQLIALIPRAIRLDALPRLEALRGALADGAMPPPLAAAAISLVVPKDAAWPAGAELPPGAPPAIVNRPNKVIAFPLDPSSGGVLGAVKRPKTATALRNCRHEFALLGEMAAADIALGPAARSSSPDHDSFHYEFIAGALPEDVPVRVFGDFARRLETGATTTPRDWARRYAAKLDALALDAGRRDALHGLLDRVRDTTPVPLGIAHGDLKPGNLVVGADGRLRAVDWEAAAREGVPLLDLVRLAFYENLRIGGARSLPELFSGPGRERLERFLAHLFPGAKPALDDLLALFFATLYVDRVELFGSPDRAYIRYLDRLLAIPAGLE